MISKVNLVSNETGICSISKVDYGIGWLHAALLLSHIWSNIDEIGTKMLLTRDGIKSS